MPIGRIKNTVPKVRADLGTSSTSGGTIIYAGTPMGLLLSLTYAVTFTVNAVTNTGKPPKVRIKTS